ncbi:hypothetical protein GCM10009680_34160 [Streptomyces yatensis]|uniref:Uncharacterized protein n=1 Tax=Streptomyces yatensis TaxID=155177 RepID=A0ABN2HQR7_9ACTN
MATVDSGSGTAVSFHSLSTWWRRTEVSIGRRAGARSGPSAMAVSSTVRYSAARRAVAASNSAGS